MQLHRRSCSGFVTQSVSCWLAAAVAVGCSAQAPIEPAIEAQKAAAYTRALIVQTSTGVGFVGNRDATLQRALEAAERIRRDLLPVLPTPLPRSFLDVIGDNPLFKSLLSNDSSQPTLQQNLDDLAAYLERWIKERLLAEANLESKTDDAATYLLKPEPTCRPLPAPGVEPPPAKEGCRKTLESTEVRVLMKALLDGVSLRFVVGPDRRELSQVIVRLDGLEWRAALAESAKAGALLDALMAPAGTGSASAPTDTQQGDLKGSFTVTVKRDGTAGALVTMKIDEAIHATRVDGTGKDVFALDVAASPNPVLTLSGNGSSKAISLELALGAIAVRTSWDPQGRGARNTDLELALASLGGRLRLLDKERTIEAPELSLGDYTAKVRGKEVFGLALGASGAGPLAVTGTLGDADGGGSVLQLPAGLKAAARFHLGQVRADLPGDLTYVPDETFTADFGAGSAPAAQARLLTRGGQLAALAVTDGQLVVTTDASADSLRATAGRCVTRAAKPAEQGHPVLRQLEVVACPAETNGGTTP